MVGFQAADPLGKRLVDGAERVKVLGEELPVKAHMHALDGFSEHADQSQLIAWAGASVTARGSIWFTVSRRLNRRSS